MKQRHLWTPEQDKVLKYLKQEQKIKKWSAIAKIMQEDYHMPGRTGKQCRQRYFNHLDSQIKREQWSYEEEQILYQMHFQYGNRWTLMANSLKGRSENCIKNHFYSKVRKAARRLNKYIIQRLKTQYKQIRTSMLYKILQTAEDKFRPGKSTNNDTMDLAASIKNRLFLFDSEASESTKQSQLIKSLIIDINKIQQILKKQSKLERNNSGFLDPKNLRKSNLSFDSEDNSSVYSSTSYNESFQPSEDSSYQASEEVKQLKDFKHFDSIKKRRSLKATNSLEVEGENESLLGTDLKFRSLQLRPSKSEKTFNVQTQIEDKVSDIAPTKPNNSCQFDKCLSDIVKFEQSQDEFSDIDDKFLNPVKSNNMQEENEINYFGQPEFMQFRLRVISPKAPSDDEKIDEQF